MIFPNCDLLRLMKTHIKILILGLVQQLKMKHRKQSISMRCSFTMCMKTITIYCFAFRFFLSQADMESPLLSDKNKLFRDDSTPEEKVLLTDNWSQTALSLPPMLPPEIEAVLSSYYTFNASQRHQTSDDLNSSNSSLSRKKLLFDDLNASERDEFDRSCCTPQTTKVCTELFFNLTLLSFSNLFTNF